MRKSDMPQNALAPAPDLEGRMYEGFSFPNEDKNIVFVNRDKLTKEQLTYVLRQYTQFPRNIVSILVSAAYNFGYHGWTSLVDELRQNVFEELGGGDGDIAKAFGTHYSILRKELQSVFEIDIDTTQASPATKKFLANVKSIVESEPAIAVGGVFALEASAIPELQIVMKFTDHLANVTGKTVTKTLSAFFSFHVDQIEVGHRDRLLELIAPKLSDATSLAKFYEGFDQVLQAMDIWWDELYLEALTARS